MQGGQITLSVSAGLVMSWKRWGHRLRRVRSSPTGIDPSSRFRSDVQGLRAIAVVAVVLYHAGVPFVQGGYIGVDVFFVISGFLITSHLLTALNRDGKIHFASFYAKRVRRILPASFAVLALSIIAALIWYPPLLLREVWRGALSTAFYIPNMLFAAEGTNYLAESTPSLFQHYWSLGIEEQFYLVWPVLLALGFGISKRPRVLFTFVVVLVAASFAACLFFTFRQQPWAFFMLPFRAWELGVGGLAAFALTYRPGLVRGVAAAVLSWAGVVGIVFAAVLFSSALAYPGYWAALPVLATAAVIVGGESRPRGGPYQALATPPMMFIGLISYSLYLVHWPLLKIPQAAVGFENPLPLWATLALGAISLPVAWLTYHVVEVPGRSGAWLARARPRRSLLAAGAASLAVSIFATGAYAWSTTRPLDAGRAVAASPIGSPPQFTGFVPSNLKPALRAVSSDQPAIYEDGCHLGFSQTTVEGCVYGDAGAPRIVLFGDSHAAQWFPAVQSFAEANGYAVENRTKSSCPSVSVDVLRDRVAYTECTTWRKRVIDRINSEKPALVLIANYGTAPIAATGAEYEATWAAALGTTLTRIETDAALIVDTPDLGFTPSICLSANLDHTDECGQARGVALASVARNAELSVTQALGVPRIDLTDEICSADACDPVIGDTLVYRDAHHLTATFSAELSEALGAQLANVLGASGGHE